MPRTSADGALDEDLYCVSCGYNLRGLFGDPARCPECGLLNDLSIAMIPAEMIRETLRKMESAPTWCVVCACLLTGSLPILAGPRSAFVCFVLVGFVSIPVWFASCAWMRSVYEGKPGWRRILLDFHVATLFCASGLILFMVYVLWKGVLPHQLSGITFVGMLLVEAAGFPIGLRIYFRARGRLHEMQRDAAIHIARERLRRAQRRRG